MTEDQILMERVDRLCGHLFDAISPPAHPTSSFSKSFILALTAGETGVWLVHNTDVPSHFDKNEYDILRLVQDGKRKSYGIATTKLLAGVSDDLLQIYSSSWGLTQIEGIECLAWNVPLSEIQNPETHYKYTLRLLNEFCQQYGLDPEVDIKEIASCWNTGQPIGATIPLAYAQNVINRMAAWESLQPS